MRNSRWPIEERPSPSIATEVDCWEVSDALAHWRGLGLPDYLGGPFEERSGGLTTFEVGSADEAERLVAADPFVQEDLLERRRVKAWLID